MKRIFLLLAESSPTSSSVWLKHQVLHTDGLWELSVFNLYFIGHLLLTLLTQPLLYSDVLMDLTRLTNLD